jgi:hypothetical protein
VEKVVRVMRRGTRDDFRESRGRRRVEKGGMNKKWKRKSDTETSRCRCYAFGSREQRDDEDQALTSKGRSRDRRLFEPVEDSSG